MDFDLGEAGKELLALQKRIEELELENERLKSVIVDNDLEEDIEDIDCTSIEEKICRDGIRYIGSLVESQDFDDKDVKNFDTLYKTLRTIKGMSATVSKKEPKLSVAEMLKLVGEDE